MNSLLPKTANSMPSRVPGDMVEKRGLAANQVIIQCPSCETKFALDREYLGGIDNPKFHCSRCDNVFRPEVDLPALETTAPSSRAALGGHKTAAAVNESKSVKTGNFSSKLQPERIVSQEQISTRRTEEDFADPRSRPARDTDFDYDDDMDTSEAAIKPSDFSISTSSYAPSTGNDVAIPAQHQITSKDFIVHAPEARSAASVISPSASLPAQSPDREFSILAPPAGSVLPAQSLQRDVRVEKQEKVVQGLSVARSMRRLVSGWNGPLVYLAPIGAVMTILVLLATSAGLNPERVSGIITSIVPSILEPAQVKVPPSGVYVKQSQLKLVTLQDGNKIPLLVGRVVNSTGAPIHGVTVEGIGFDSSARAVVSRRAPIRSELAREKPEFLTKETVARLESIAPMRRQVLEPGEAAEFAVVLESGKDQADIAYYSARIFSVQ